MLRRLDWLASPSSNVHFYSYACISMVGWVFVYMLNTSLLRCMRYVHRDSRTKHFVTHEHKSTRTPQTCWDLIDDTHTHTHTHTLNTSACSMRRLTCFCQYSWHSTQHTHIHIFTHYTHTCNTKYSTRQTHTQTNHPTIYERLYTCTHIHTYIRDLLIHTRIHLDDKHTHTHTNTSIPAQRMLWFAPDCL